MATARPSAKSSTAERPTGTQLLDRAVAVLRILSENAEEGCRLGDLAAAADLNTPTTHRIVAALERHGLVERDRTTRVLRLGLALFALGAGAADETGLRRICRPALLRLCGETGESVFLMARNGLDTICVDRQAGSYLLDSMPRHVGGTIPLGMGSASIAILAQLQPDEIEAVLAANAARYAAYDVKIESIRKHLIHCQKNGYVVTDGLMVKGIAAVAMPIRPQGRDVTVAIAINLTSARLTAKWKKFILQKLADEVEEIENQLKFASL